MWVHDFRPAQPNSTGFLKKRTAMKAKMNVNKDFPFLGLEAYSEEYSSFFFGRKTETLNLFEQVESQVITVLYGKSGVGKSSLLQAGLIPELKRNYYLPVYIHLNFSIRKLSPTKQLKQIIEREIKRTDKSVIEFDDKTLWEYFHTVKILDGHIKPVLIFDQFEEIFTIEKESQRLVNEFITEIANLIENQIPVKAKEKYPDKNIPFDFSRQNYRVVLSLREDYLAQLENLNAFIPSLKKSRIRLQPMEKQEAIEVVKKAGAHILKEGMAERIVDMIFSKMVPNFGKTIESEQVWENYQIEPFLLSLICYQINNLRIQEYAPEISDELLNRVDIARIIRNFYYQSTYDLNQETRNILENALLTQDGYRKMQPKSELLMRGSISEGDFRKLINRRIIRTEIWNDSEHVELIHDVLVPVVKESRDKRLTEERKRRREEELREIKRQEEKKRLAEKRKMQAEKEALQMAHKHKMRTARIVALVVGFTAIISFVLATFAFNQKQKAQQSAEQALSTRIASDALLKIQQDPTLSFRLGELAFKTAPTEQAKRAIRQAFYQGNFYSVFLSGAMYTKAEYSPNGKYILVAKQNIAQLYDLEGKLLLELKGHSANLNVAKFSRSGKYIVTAGKDKTARVWSIKGNLIGQIKGHRREILHATFSPDEAIVATAGADNQVKLWTRKGEPYMLLSRETSNVVCTDFSPDGTKLLTASFNRSVVVHSLDGTTQSQFELKSPLQIARFLPGGDKIIASTRDHQTVITDLQGNILVQFQGMKGAANSIEFSPKNKYVLFACDDKKIYLYNLQGKKLSVFKGHTGPVLKADFSPRLDYIVSAALDKTVRRWKIVSLKRGQFLTFDDFLYNAEFSPDEETLLAAHGKQVSLWNLKRKKLSEIKFQRRVRLARFSPDGKYIAVATQDTLTEVFDRNGQSIGKFYYDAPFSSVAFSPDSKQIIGTTLDGFAIVWNIENQKQILELQNPNDDEIGSAAVSPDGQYILTSGENARLWDWQGNEIGSYSHNEYIVSVAFAPGGKFLVTGSLDKTAKIWKLNGELLAILEGHTGEVNSAKFSPDGNYVITASDDNTVKLWDTNGNELFSYNKHNEPVLFADFTLQSEYIISNSGSQIRLWPISIHKIFEHVNQIQYFGEVWRLDENIKARYKKIGQE